MSETIWGNLSNRAKMMTRDAFKDVKTSDDWKRIEATRRREFARALGLDPKPERPDLKVTDHGAFSGDGFRARKIAFQILPDCWSSANLYYPDPAPEKPAPAVLYVCGHAQIGTWHYQYHPIMWARRGYACLIVDTIEQNDNPGEHHDFIMGWNESWLAMGYTPAGAEVLNAVRALDVLAEDPAVDSERLAVTGASGGGACSFHAAIFDQRIKAVSTLCGVSSPIDAIVNRGLHGHCSCMYPRNLFRRDISEYAALIAPRAALFCFADHDTLFHPDETAAVAERTKKIYELLDFDDRCELVTCPGKHGDHRQFDEATQAWFDRHVAGEERPILARGERELDEKTTCVFQGRPPAPDNLPVLPELISPRGAPPLPGDESEWASIRPAALDALNLPPFAGQSSFELVHDWRVSRGYRGEIEGVEVWLQTNIAPDGPDKVILSVANEGEHWRQALCRLGCAADPGAAAFASFEPRVAAGRLPLESPNDYPPGSRLASSRIYHLRAMALVGLTPVMMMIDDLTAALDFLFKQDEMKGRKLFLLGRGASGVAVLFKALFDERVAGVVAEDVPSSLQHDHPILGALRAFDVQHAVGLMAPRGVALSNPGHRNWTWPQRVYERLGCPDRFVNTCDLRSSIDKLLASRSKN